MSIVFWIIGAIAVALIRKISSGKLPKFPRLPNGRHDTPLGPGGHRSWPVKPPVVSSSPSRPVAPANEPAATVNSSVSETHDSVAEGQVSAGIVAAPDHETVKRRKQAAEPRTSPVAFGKDDLVRAVVMAELLGPPRSRQKNRVPGRRSKQ
jgi:hypothetical protein